jgi:hypothetical protein
MCSFVAPVRANAQAGMESFDEGFEEDSLKGYWDEGFSQRVLVIRLPDRL